LAASNDSRIVLAEHLWSLLSVEGEVPASEGVYLVDQEGMRPVADFCWLF